MRAVVVCVSWLLCNLVYSALPMEGWYSGLMLSGTQASSFSFSVLNPLTRQIELGRIDYKTSLNGGAQLGYRYGKSRFELEMVYNRSPYRRVLVGNSFFIPDNQWFYWQSVGNTRFIAAFANAFYELYPADQELSVIPYAGLGLGLSSVNNTYSLNGNSHVLYARRDSAYSPMGQAILGLSYLFTDSCSASLDVRYMSSPNHQTLQSSVAVSSVNFIVNLSFT